MGKMVFNRPRPLGIYKSLFGCMKCTGSQSLAISEETGELVWKCHYCGTEDHSECYKIPTNKISDKEGY